MFDMDEIVLVEKKYSKDAVNTCKELLKTYDKGVVIDNWDRSYTTYRYTHENGKLTREKLFELQCVPEGFGDIVKYIIIGDLAYPGGAVARNLLIKVAALYDAQQSKQNQKLKQQKNITR